MNQKRPSSEQGQVLVLLVLVIVGLLAFTALAIDGGLLLADRRGAQNAGDAAVLAGGYRVANTLEDYEKGYTIDYEDWNCSDVSPVIALAKVEAAQQAAANSYPITNSLKIDSSIAMVCEGGKNYGSYVDKYVDTTASITSRVDSAFAHFVFEGGLQNSIIAVSRVRPRMPLGFGYPVYAHRDSCDNISGNVGGVRINGSVQVTIEPFRDIDGNFYSVMSDDCITKASGANLNSNGGMVNRVGAGPIGVQQSNVLPVWSLLFSEINCETYLSSSSSNGDGTINPGIYNSITVGNGQVLTMNPGLYCFDGNFVIQDGGKVKGNGVTIYMRSGNFNSNGGSDVRLNAPAFSLNSGSGMTGVLIYMVEGNAGTITLRGHYVDSDDRSYFIGTVYAADADSTISISGAGNQMIEYNIQAIAGRVRFQDGGTSVILDPYKDTDYIYFLPARLTLEQ
jgi:hypothetical protein